MKKLYVLLPFLLFPFFYSAQTEVSQFSIPSARDVWKLAEPETGQTFLLFHHHRSFQLRWFNEEMRVVDSVKISKPSKRRYRDILVHGVIQDQEEIHIFYSRINRRAIKGLKLHKRTHTCTPFDPQLVSEKTDPFSVLKSFTHDEQFYVFMVGQVSNDLRVYVYDSPTQYRLYQYSLGVPRLFQRLKRPEGMFIPMVTNPWENVLASNVLQEKLYEFPGELIMTVEQEDKGITEVFYWDTEEMTLRSEQYEVAGWQDKGAQVQINSYIYENQLFQAVVNEEGLTLSARDLDNGALIRRRNFPTDASVKDYLGPMYRIKFQEGESNTVRINEILNRLSRSLGIIILPNNETSDMLTIGAHRYMKPAVRNALGILTVAMAAAGEAGMISATSNQAFATMSALTEAAYQVDYALAINQGSYYYLETPISFRDFVKMGENEQEETEDAPPNGLAYPWEEGEDPIWGFIQFEMNSATYIGVGQGSTYRIWRE